MEFMTGLAIVLGGLVYIMISITVVTILEDEMPADVRGLAGLLWPLAMVVISGVVVGQWLKKRKRKRE